jgi:hypothetical protein
MTKLVNLPRGAVIIEGHTIHPLAELRRIGPVIDMAKLRRPAASIKNGDDAVEGGAGRCARFLGQAFCRSNNDAGCCLIPASFDGLRHDHNLSVGYRPRISI